MIEGINDLLAKTKASLVKSLTTPDFVKALINANQPSTQAVEMPLELSKIGSSPGRANGG